MPQDDTSIVLVGPAPESMGAFISDAAPIVADEIRVAEDGTSLAATLRNGEQIAILSAATLTPATPTVALIPLGPEGFDRIEATYRLLLSLHRRPIPSDTRLTPQQRLRQQRMLQSFDAYRAGATQLEIAQVLFHIGKMTRSEWQSSSARHAVASLQRDGRAMVIGGYRKLLRHRRRA